MVNCERNEEQVKKEIETKLAALLMQNYRSWGIDKKELPIILIELKTILQDAKTLKIKKT